MTKSHERGENEITDEAKRRASREARDVCSILREMLAEARSRGDAERVRKIVRAEKYLGCRNIRRRRGP
jgi:hypothetical protein